MRLTPALASCVRFGSRQRAEHRTEKIYAMPVDAGVGFRDRRLPGMGRFQSVRWETEVGRTMHFLLFPMQSIDR